MVDNPSVITTYEGRPISNQNLDSPAAFDKELKKYHLSANESVQIANEMLAYFSNKIIEACKKRENTNNNTQLKHIQTVLHFLKEKMKKPPQSGSSNIFWKNIYISFPKT